MAEPFLNAIFQKIASGDLGLLGALPYNCTVSWGEGVSTLQWKDSCWEMLISKMEDPVREASKTAILR